MVKVKMVKGSSSKLDILVIKLQPTSTGRKKDGTFKGVSLKIDYIKCNGQMTCRGGESERNRDG